MKTDIQYMISFPFAKFMPNTERGVDAWHEMAAQMGGDVVIHVQHLPSVLNQIKSAGYSVRKARKPSNKMTSLDIEKLCIQLGI